MNWETILKPILDSDMKTRIAERRKMGFPVEPASDKVFEFTKHISPEQVKLLLINPEPEKGFQRAIDKIYTDMYSYMTKEEYDKLAITDPLDLWKIGILYLPIILTWEVEYTEFHKKIGWYKLHEAIFNAINPVKCMLDFSPDDDTFKHAINEVGSNHIKDVEYSEFINFKGIKDKYTAELRKGKYPNQILGNMLNNKESFMESIKRFLPIYQSFNLLKQL